MIRRRLADGELHIPQDEHARQAGRLAALLLPYPGDAVVRAVSLHDAGWPHPSPHVFDAPSNFPAWRRSVAIARAAGAFEALLVSRHFSAFSEEFAAEQHASQAAWRCGVTADAERAGLAVLQLCDAISLAVLCDPGTSLNLPGGLRVDPDGVVDPWPFALPDFTDTVVGDWAQSDQMGPIGPRWLTVHFRPKSFSSRDS